jgi:hypothetical protein
LGLEGGFPPERHLPALANFASILPVFNPFKEFRMGMFFNTRTWRQPLQLIDSWLPAPTLAQTTRGLSRNLSPFEKAGWLGQSTRAPSASRGMRAPQGMQSSFPRRGAHTVDGGVARADGCFVISGRIGDVCDELDRLAALEQGDRPLS